jgi:hypothetical protein
MAINFSDADSVFLTRREAAAHLLEKFGTPGSISPATLAKLAVIGGGPAIHRFGRKVGYLARDLDAWMATRFSGPLKNTSDEGKHHD